MQLASSRAGITTENSWSGAEGWGLFIAAAEIERLLRRDHAKLCVQNGGVHGSTQNSLNPAAGDSGSYTCRHPEQSTDPVA
jgi:hypothetical protein